MAERGESVRSMDDLMALAHRALNTPSGVAKVEATTLLELIGEVRQWRAAFTSYDGPVTNYEVRVPESLREHAEDLMIAWRKAGRSDEQIENIVKSVVLAAYAHGVVDGEGPYEAAASEVKNDGPADAN